MLRIEKTIELLNTIEVHGKSNIDRLLACIILLEQQMQEQQRPETANTPQEIQNETN